MDEKKGGVLPSGCGLWIISDDGLWIRIVVGRDGDEKEITRLDGIGDLATRSEQQGREDWKKIFFHRGLSLHFVQS